MIRLARALRARDDERGVALVAVVGVGMVVMLLVATMVAVATSGAGSPRTTPLGPRARTPRTRGSRTTSRGSTPTTPTGTTGRPTHRSVRPAAASSRRGPAATLPSTTSPVPPWVSIPTAERCRRRLVVPVRGRQQPALDAGRHPRAVHRTLRRDDTDRRRERPPRRFSNYLYFTNYESGDPTVTNEKGIGTSACTSAYRPAAVTSTCDQIQFGAERRARGAGPFERPDQGLRLDVQEHACRASTDGRARVRHRCADVRVEPDHRLHPDAPVDHR